MEIITLDFETYFDVDYTLTKLSTSEYIRDSRFFAHCVGVHTNAYGVKWIPRGYIQEELNKFDWANSAVLCHNTAFDGLILSHHYNTHPAQLLDTMSMARGWFGISNRAGLDAVAVKFGLGNKLPDVLNKTKGLRELPSDLAFDLGMYCIQDVVLCRQIYDNFISLGFPESELEIIHHTIKAFTEPRLRVNQANIKRELVRLQLARADILGKAATILDVSLIKALKVLGSGPQFALALRSFGIVPPTKISPRTEKTTFAFAKSDLEFQSLQKHPDPKIRTLCKARLNAKSTIGLTRAQRLLTAAKPALPVLMNYCGAHTMRFSAGNKINMQNLPRINLHVPTSGQLRKSIQAPYYHLLVIVDSAQVEDRMNCYVSGETTILEAYRRKEDAYKLQATALYGGTTQEITSSQRFLGKVARLALGYGCGWRKFAHIVRAGLMGPAIDISDIDAETIVRAYRRSNSKIRHFWAVCTDIIRFMANGRVWEYKAPGTDIVLFTTGRECIHMPNGLMLHYPGLSIHPDNGDATYVGKSGTRVKIYGALVAENIIQCLARIAVIDQIMTVATTEPNSQLALLVHDEGVLITPRKDAKRVLAKMILAMETAPEWCPTLPFGAEGMISRYYAKP